MPTTDDGDDDKNGRKKLFPSVWIWLLLGGAGKDEERQRQQQWGTEDDDFGRE